MKSQRWALLPLLAVSFSCAGLMQEIERTVDPAAGSTAADGLREALAVGTARAVERRGRPGGYLGDALAEIAVPAKFDQAARALELLGREDLVEEFKLGMNRAAEAAAPVARDVFLRSVRQMTFTDAVSILKGDDTAATDFFRRTAGPELAARFSPIVNDKLAEVGATEGFDRLMRRIEALPLVDKPVFDLTDYVTGEALDALFETLAEEERRIRTDPLARTTALLKKWFGGDVYRS